MSNREINRVINLEIIKIISEEVAMALKINGEKVRVNVDEAATISLQGNGITFSSSEEFLPQDGPVNIKSDEIREYIRMQIKEDDKAPRVLVVKPNVILGAIIGGVASALGTTIPALQAATIVGVVLSVQGAWSGSFSRLTDNESWVCYAIWSCLRDAEFVSAAQLLEYVNVSMMKANFPVMSMNELVDLLKTLVVKKIIKMNSQNDGIEFLELQVVSA